MSIKSNLEKVISDIRNTEAEFGRKDGSVKLLAVSKTKPVEDVIEAYNCGQRLFGENKVQEAEEKVPKLPSDAQFHMIGHLQSNKVNKACQYFSCIQSVDSLKIAKKIDNRCKVLDKIMDIYLDINISGEESKTGFNNDDNLISVVNEILELKHIRVIGLMAIGSHVEDRELIKSSFKDLKELLFKLQNEVEGFTADQLSIGMSGDYKEAIQMGSTMVRIGSSIFGSRY